MNIKSLFMALAMILVSMPALAGHHVRHHRDGATFQALHFRGTNGSRGWQYPSMSAHWVWVPRHCQRVFDSANAHQQANFYNEFYACQHRYGYRSYPSP